MPDSRPELEGKHNDIPLRLNFKKKMSKRMKTKYFGIYGTLYPEQTSIHSHGFA